MRHVANGLVWAVLVFGVTTALVAFGPDRSASTALAPAPRHDASGCRPCRSGLLTRAPALPFEIDDRNIHTVLR